MSVRLVPSSSGSQPFHTERSKFYDSSTILVTFKRHCADARPIGPGAHVGAARSPRSPLRAAAPAGAAADSQGLLSVRRSNLQTYVRFKVLSKTEIKTNRVLVNLGNRVDGCPPQVPNPPEIHQHSLKHMHTKHPTRGQHRARSTGGPRARHDVLTPDRCPSGTGCPSEVSHQRSPSEALSLWSDHDPSAALLHQALAGHRWRGEGLLCEDVVHVIARRRRRLWCRCCGDGRRGGRLGDTLCPIAIAVLTITSPPCPFPSPLPVGRAPW